MNHPTEEDFDAWRESGVTRWVMRAVERVAAQQQKAWLDASWEGGIVDPHLLVELRTRADAYRALNETGYTQWLGFNETDQETAAREEGAPKGEEG